MLQMPLFTPRSEWRPPSLAELPDFSRAKRVGFDVETRDEQLTKLGPGVRRGGNNYPVGYSIAIEDGPKYYLPIRHLGGDNMDVEPVLNYLRENFKNFNGELAGANLSYDLDWAWQEDILMPNVKRFRDVQVAQPLIYELDDSYSLETIANKHLGIGKSETALLYAATAYGVHAKKELWKLPGRHVGEYGADDAAIVLPILRKQERIIEDQDLWRVYDLESDLLPVLVKMRRQGVRIDQDKLSQIERWCLEQEFAALRIVKDLTGRAVHPNEVMNSRVLAPVLEARGVKAGTTRQGKASVNKDLLHAYSDDEAVAAIIRARSINKVRTTFVKSVREHMVDGRIHCTFNQLRKTDDGDDEDSEGGRFGRLSCVDPNLQQQPARDPELGPMWRSIYLPDDGCEWHSLDYSQQEPRMVIHWAVEAGPKLIGVSAYEAACEAAKKYRDDPTTDNHQMMADMANIKRKAAKEIFLGLCYGMGGAKLCRKLGLPTMMAVYDRAAFAAVPLDTSRGAELIAQGGRPYEAAGTEGAALLDAFDKKVPFVKRLAKCLEKYAKERGYIRCISGRRCRFPARENGGFDWAHKALNRLIQGSSADQTKMAMVELDRAGMTPQLQIHDEVTRSNRSRAEGEAMVEIMCSCTPLHLPSKVDLEIGDSWGDSM